MARPFSELRDKMRPEVRELAYFAASDGCSQVRLRNIQFGLGHR